MQIAKSYLISLSGNPKMDRNLNIFGYDVIGRNIELATCKY